MIANEPRKEGEPEPVVLPPQDQKDRTPLGHMRVENTTAEPILVPTATPWRESWIPIGATVWSRNLIEAATAADPAFAALFTSGKLVDLGVYQPMVEVTASPADDARDRRIASLEGQIAALQKKGGK